MTCLPSGCNAPAVSVQAYIELSPRCSTKKSGLWEFGMTKLSAHRTAAEASKTEVIMVADSEADFFELMVEGQTLEGRAEWIVRACQDRAVRLEKDAENDAARSITQALQAATCHAT